mmetsp:Transcript_52689/g.146799  ORF Transcript_52689/g.146799 Transcript_52689/m.146799 type:complete len:224 (-) Transcript_52689:3005-3676(-)
MPFRQPSRDAGVQRWTLHRHRALRLRLLGVELLGQLLDDVRGGQDPAAAGDTEAQGQTAREGMRGAPPGDRPLQEAPLRGAGVRLERVVRLVRLLEALRSWYAPPASGRPICATQRRDALQARVQGRAGALQRAGLPEGVRRRGLGGLGRVVRMCRELRGRLPLAPPGRGAVRERVRNTGERPPGAVRRLRGAAQLRKKRGLQALSMGTVVPLQRLVLRAAPA